MGSSPLSGTERAGAAMMPQTRRRRPATGPAQEQRKAWGREWGGIVADYWKTLKRRQG